LNRKRSAQRAEGERSREVRLCRTWTRWLDALSREAFARELLPPTILWLLAADGMIGWYRWLSRGLRDQGEDPRILARPIAHAVRRRYDALSTSYDLPSGARFPALMAAGLYRTFAARRVPWIYDDLGGPPRGREWVTALRLAGRLDHRQRWIEVATHLYMDR
jgi:hypothetical protein